MEKFIYVFDSAEKEKLLAAGFVLLKEDNDKGIYIFLASSEIEFALNGTSHILTNVLTF